MLQHALRRAGSIAIAAVVTGVFANCDATSLVSPPGTGEIRLTYLGDTVASVGRLIVPEVEVLVGTRPLDDPQLSYSSSDPSVLEVMPGGQLYIRRLGTASLVVSLRGSLLPANAPSVTRLIQAVAESISVSTPALTLTAVGASAVVAASAFDFNGLEILNPSIRWESSQPAIVAVTQGGIITAKGPGTSEVRAILGPDTARVSVAVAQTLASYAMSHEDVTFDALGDTLTVTASSRDANGNIIPESLIPGPVWTSRDPSVVDITIAGKVTSRRNASTWVVAQRGVVADSVRFTVNQQAVQVVISSATGYDIGAINGNLQLSAAGFDHNSNPDGNSPTSWSSLHPGIAQVNPLSGLVTGRAVGTAQIIATIDAGTDTVFVNVANTPSQLVLTPATLAMTSVFDTAQLTVAAYNSLGAPVSTEVTWRSTDPTVVGIVPGSRIDARGVGTARVIASTGSLADTTVVTVTNNPALIDFTDTNLSLTYVDQTTAPGITIKNARDDNLPRTAVTFRSDDPSIATVSNDGGITARQPGVTYVRATWGSLGDSIRVTVTNNPASIVVSADRDTVTAVGRTITYSAEVRNAGNAVMLAYPVGWRSTNTSIATVSSAGVVTAVATGTSMIIATAGTVEDTVTLVVRNPSVLWVDNSVVAAERFGTLSRPYARIQDAVDVADAGDTVIVRRGFGYTASVSLTRRIVLLGDSTAYVTGGRNPAALPAIAHDTGAAGIIATTTAQITIRYLSMTHSVDGPAVVTDGADVRIDNFHVNPGASSIKIGRGILVRDAPTFAALADIVVRNVRGYGVRLERVTQGQVDRVTVWGVDSISGTRGAGIDVYRGSVNDVRFSTVRETQGPGVLLDSTTSASLLDSDLAGRSVLARVRGVSGTLTAIDRNRFDLTVLAGASDTRGSANDGRSGLEIVSSANVQVRDNVFTESGSALMDGIRLIQAKGGGAFLGVTIFRNRFTGGRYSVRSERSSWTMTESASNGATAGVFATDADTVQLLSDTVTATTGDACVSSTGAVARIEIIGGRFAQCGASGAVGGRAVAVSGTSGTTLTVRSALLGGPNQTAIDFSGRDITLRSNTIVGSGARTVTSFVGGGVLDVMSTGQATIHGNAITDHAGLIGLLLDVATLSLDSNIVARNRVGVQLTDWGSVGAIDNDFSDHELLGVLNSRSTTVSFSNNWWGDPRGPRRVLAPDATGDSVGTLVSTGTLKTAPFYPGTIASAIRIVRGDGQTAARRAVLPVAFTVRVMDDAGRPVMGTTVTFTVVSGGGTVSSGTAVTNASGLAETTLTLGASAGQNTVRASIASPGGQASVTFTATGT